METMDLTKLSAAELQKLLKQKQAQEREVRENEKKAYEELRGEFLAQAIKMVDDTAQVAQNLHSWLSKEAPAFYEVMKNYGQLRREGQGTYTISDDTVKVEVKRNKVKGFDERADIAAERLIEYLQGYIKRSDKGIDDPMYQLAMTLLERNKYGDLDYKSVSKLYGLEDKFDEEYRDIMKLFKESNVVERNAINFYFHRRDNLGVWRKIEPSFCRL